MNPVQTQKKNLTYPSTSDPRGEQIQDALRKIVRSIGAIGRFRQEGDNFQYDEIFAEGCDIIESLNSPIAGVREGSELEAKADRYILRLRMQGLRQTLGEISDVSWARIQNRVDIGSFAGLKTSSELRSESAARIAAQADLKSFWLSR